MWQTCSSGPAKGAHSHNPSHAPVLGMAEATLAPPQDPRAAVRTPRFGVPFRTLLLAEAEPGPDVDDPLSVERRRHAALRAAAARASKLAAAVPAPAEDRPRTMAEKHLIHRAWNLRKRVSCRPPLEPLRRPTPLRRTERRPGSRVWALDALLSRAAQVERTAASEARRMRQATEAAAAFRAEEATLRRPEGEGCRRAVRALRRCLARSWLDGEPVQVPLAAMKRSSATKAARRERIDLRGFLTGLALSSLQPSRAVAEALFLELADGAAGARSDGLEWSDMKAALQSSPEKRRAGTCDKGARTTVVPCASRASAAKPDGSRAPSGGLDVVTTVGTDQAGRRGQRRQGRSSPVARGRHRRRRAVEEARRRRLAARRTVEGKPPLRSVWGRDKGVAARSDFLPDHAPRR
jgi:hypothetical protein